MNANYWKCTCCGYTSPKVRLNMPANSTKPCPKCGSAMRPKE